MLIPQAWLSSALQPRPHSSLRVSEWERSNRSPDFKAGGFRCHLGCFFLIRSIVNPQKCASDTLGMRIPDAVWGAAEMQMIQLQNYQQWDASLQADPWLFLGKSSKPPLHLSPPPEIRAENIIPYSLGLHFLPALQQGNGGVAVPLPGHGFAGWHPSCQQCQEGQTGAQTRPCWPFPSARRVCPDSCWARATAWCCCCYFLLVFLDIDTSSLHPQDGFQASILFPMATKTQPGNLKPLSQLSGRGGRWGKLQHLWAGHSSSTQNY